MSEQNGKVKKPQKKPVRYFGEVNNKNDDDKIERIEVNTKKKGLPFKGDVIQVQEKAKFYGKTIWRNKRPEKGQNKFKKNRKAIKVEVDPYAKQRHSRKLSKLIHISLKGVNAYFTMTFIKVGLRHPERVL